MGKNRYTRAIELLEEIKKDYGNKISLSDLRFIIQKNIGDCVVKPYLKFMVNMRLIKINEFDVELL
jgi:hypothetical protein